MPILDTDVQKKIMMKVGDIDPVTGDPLAYGLISLNGLVGQNMPLLWASHADKAQLTPRLRELYVERDSYDLILGCLSALVDYTLEGETTHLSQRVTNIQKRRDAVQVDIGTVLKSALGQRAPAVGPIQTVAPVSPPTGPIFYPWGPDGNDPAYSGSPYLPTRRRS